MAPLEFPPRLVSAFPLLLFALLSKASPTVPRDTNLLVTVNSSIDATVPHCYTPDGQDTPGIQSTNLNSCQDALRTLVHTQDFTTAYRFSKNPRTMAKKIPIGWQFESDARCRIVVSCENDRDSAIFRYADVAQVARSIINNCVDKPDPFGRFPLLIWGGVHPIKGEETFYVAVATPRPSGPGLELGNRTMVVNAVRVDEGVQFS